MDAQNAARLGAAYVGVIFADSPRQVDEATARAVFSAAGEKIGHVAVFGTGSPEDIAIKAEKSHANVVQLHGDQTASDVEKIRRRFRGKIWIVASLDPASPALPSNTSELAEMADAILVDARVDGRLGGTGHTLNWDRLVEGIATVRERTELILAGGLTPENVAAAIRAMQPDIVDVSSGVEMSPGVKDGQRMEAFAEAVRSASIVEREIPPPLKVE